MNSKIDRPSPSDICCLARADLLRRSLGLLMALVMTGWSVPRCCLAGLTASEVVVVVNGGSLNSRTLANHYVKLRQIPAINVVVLDSVPNSEVIPVDAFRESILRPLLEVLNQRGLAGHVQCIAYSADFPTGIDIKKDLESIQDLHEIFTPVASINSLTFLYELSLVGNPAYITPEANYYARRSMDSYFSNPAGNVLQEKWESIEDLISSEKHDDAIRELDVLARSLPHQHPLSYMAAAVAAKAEQPDLAVSLLETAINRGWNSGGYLAKDTRFESLRNREDFQLLEILLDSDLGKWQSTIGFNSRAFWAPNGVRFLASNNVRVPGIRYLLSTVLGVTRGGGTTLSEAIAALNRAAQADFTHPEGSFYFTSTKDIRSQTREPLFADAIEELKKLGFDAEVVRTPMPMRKRSVLGVQMGVPRFDWSKSFSTLVPGAIADNLTSFGGAMARTTGQTRLTELIKAGAAGSSGTVTEPFSLQFKFPDPYLYVHYARGATLAEAFYQSVTGPYQLLIVGDPLCQPFSSAPNQPFDKSLRQIDSDQPRLQFEVDLSGPKFSDWLQLPEPPSKRKVSMAPGRIAVQVNGGSPKSGIVQPTINVQLQGLQPGYHEVQVLLIADDPINQRTGHTIPAWIGTPDLIQLSMSDTSGQPTTSDKMQFSFQSEKLFASVQAPADISEVSIWHDFELLASVEYPEQQVTELEVTPSRLGMGPVRLQAKARMLDGTMVASTPTWIELVP